VYDAVLANVRWASEPNAIIQYFAIISGVGIAAVIAAGGVLLTSSDERRIRDSQ